jgi:ABC-type Zn2+ transport system substrate-binding protein/surface adhesin
MTRTVIIAVIAGLVFSGFEAVAETGDVEAIDAHGHGHEIHSSAHTGGHDHDDSTDHDDHFCHCGLHAPALLSSYVTPVAPAVATGTTLHDGRFSSLPSPPLLRPPNA